MNPRSHARNAITLLETIFAIGVILVGLLGLASLIPIAAGNARATLEMDQSISEATSVAAASVARNTISLDTLVIYDKPVAGGPAWRANVTAGPTYLRYAYLPTKQPQTIRWKLEGQTDTYVTPALPPVGTPTVIGKLESPGYGHHDLYSGLTSGICVDPIGMPALPYINANPSTSIIPDPTATSNAYDYSRFPYYSERFNPLESPSVSVPTPAAAPPAWPMSPRMWRATLLSNLQDDGTAPVHPREMVPTFAARQIFSGFSGIDTIGGPDREDPGGILLGRTIVGGNYVDAGRGDSTEYTWFATLAPPIDGGDLFRQSIVVVRQRNAPVPRAAGDPTALNDQNYIAAEPDQNPSNERLTWIGQSIGFDGGSGGEVLMYGPQAVISDIKTNEWVMLSRQPHTSPAPPATPAPVGPAVHRWFRVLGADDPETGIIDGIYEPNWVGGTNHPVWRRWVTLAGPDWSFGFGGPTPTLADDTFCTIVQGAVSVYQSEVQLN